MPTMVRGGRKADGFYASDTPNRVATPIHPMYQDNIFSTAHLIFTGGSMSKKVMYIVGCKVQTVIDVAGKDHFTIPTDGPEFNTLVIPRYYRDTRDEYGHSDWFDTFTSSHNPLDATKYDNYEDAVKWNETFLHGDGIIYRL